MVARGEPWRVLVVDDDDDFRALVCEILVAEGFEVGDAADGFEALGRLDGQHALVCDLDMPGLDGAALVRRLRKRGLDPVIVVLSGRFDLLGLASELGEIYALGKPFEPERLTSVLREALEGRC